MAGVNSYGPSKSTLDDEMRAFDILPPAVRAAIREAALPWGAKQAAEMMIAGAPPEYVAAAIRAYDAALGPIECAKVYGAGHPGAA